MEKTLDFLVSNWAVLSPVFIGIVELLLRLFPTNKNISLISAIARLIDKTIPNLKTGGGTHIILLATFLSFASLTSKAQNNGSFKGIYSWNTADTAALQATRYATQNLYGNTGGLYFDKTRNKWRVWAGTCPTCVPRDSAWVDLFQGGGASCSFNNALSVTGTTVQWGGSLVKNTSVNQSTYTLGIDSANLKLTGYVGKYALEILTPNSLFTTGALRIHNGSAEIVDINADGSAFWTGKQTINAAKDGDYTVEIKSYSSTGSSGALLVRNFSGANTFVVNGDQSVYMYPNGSTGTAGQFLQTDGSGKLSYATAAGGSPAGSNTQIQYNNSGAFGASSDFVWDNTNKIVTINSAGFPQLKLTGSGGSLTGQYLVGGVTYAGANALIKNNTDGITIQTPGVSASRSLTINNNSSVAGETLLVISNLPTSSAGLPSGAIWNNAGVLNIVP